MTLHKKSWSSRDFDEMDWRYSRLYAISIPDEDFCFCMDIDFVFQLEISKGAVSGFWVSPSELRFIDVSNFKVDVTSGNQMLLFIEEIKRCNRRLSPNGAVWLWDYDIVLDCGHIKFTASGYSMDLRAEPKLIETQDLNRPPCICHQN